MLTLACHRNPVHVNIYFQNLTQVNVKCEFWSLVTYNTFCGVSELILFMIVNQ